MLWSAYLLAETAPASADPLNQVVGKLLGYGLAGIAVMVLGVILYKGIFTRTSDAEARLAAQKAEYEARLDAAKADADKRVAEARADLLREIGDLHTRLERSESELREARNFIRDRLVPLLQQFTQATEALLPILQSLTRFNELPFRRREHDDEHGRQ